VILIHCNLYPIHSLRDKVRLREAKNEDFLLAARSVIIFCTVVDKIILNYYKNNQASPAFGSLVIIYWKLKIFYVNSCTRCGARACSFIHRGGCITTGPKSQCLFINYLYMINSFSQEFSVSWKFFGKNI
jgi:hypothetical protein